MADMANFAQMNAVWDGWVPPATRPRHPADRRWRPRLQGRDHRGRRAELIVQHRSRGAGRSLAAAPQPLHRQVHGGDLVGPVLGCSIRQNSACDIGPDWRFAAQNSGTARVSLTRLTNVTVSVFSNSRMISRLKRRHVITDHHRRIIGRQIKADRPRPPAPDQRQQRPARRSRGSRPRPGQWASVSPCRAPARTRRAPSGSRRGFQGAVAQPHHRPRQSGGPRRETSPARSRSEHRISGCSGAMPVAVSRNAAGLGRLATSFETMGWPTKSAAHAGGRASGRLERQDRQNMVDDLGHLFGRPAATPRPRARQWMVQAGRGSAEPLARRADRNRGCRW